MWCDNCLLFFPLRAGAVVLAVIMALYQLAGGLILFELGDFLFFHPPDAMVYAGFAILQGVVALIAAIAISNRSYLFSRLMLYVYPILLVLGAIRGALMAWELKNWEYRIIGECWNGGHQWLADDYTNSDGIVVSTYAYNTTTTLPSAACNLGIDNLVLLFILWIVIDYIFMLYFTFLVWRSVVKLQHYPIQKGVVMETY